jgi:hypothetical protein
MAIEGLLSAVVATIAQRLPIGAIPERWIGRAMVAPDVVDHCGSGGPTLAEAHGAQRVPL